MRRWLLVAGGLLALGGAAVAAVPSLRRLAKVCWLRAGDALASRPEARPAPGGLLIFDGASAEDRRALAPTYGALEVRAAEGATLLSAPTPGRHEACTRRLPADWSAHQVLRLELARPVGGYCRADPRPVPLRLALRVRARPGWRETAWYRHESYVSTETRRHEVSLDPARAFIDIRGVRQLCLALVSEAESGSPSLLLRRMVLGPRLPVRAPPAGPALSLRLIGDSRKLRRDDPMPREAAQTQLVAARNEVVAFQAVIARGRGGPPSVVVRMAPLVGPGGVTLEPRLHVARWLAVKEPSSAMYGPGSPGPGEYPDPLPPLGPGGTAPLEAGNNLVWVDILVPGETPVGEYSSELHAGPLSQPVRLRVLAPRLPETDRQLVMVYYSPHLIREALGVTGEAFTALDRAYHRLVHAHGAYLASDPPLENMPRYRPMLDGTLFESGPGRGQPPPYWPVDLQPRDRRAPLQAAAARTIRWFEKNAPRTRPFAYLADEPGSLEDYQRIRRLASWIHEAPAPGNRLPVMVTEQVSPQEPGWPSLVGSVDYWVSAESFPEPARSRRRQTRERFFTYNGRQPGAGRHTIDADGVSLRSWGWIAWLFEIDMWFYWQGTYYRDEHNGGPRLAPEHLFTDPLTFDQRRGGRDIAFGNGDGVLVYPGASPIASIRLKQIRRGVQDRLYLLLAQRCGKGREARAIARKLIPRAMNEAKGCARAWLSDEAAWERARLGLLRLLEGCAR